MGEGTTPVHHQPQSISTNSASAPSVHQEQHQQHQPISSISASAVPEHQQHQRISSISAVFYPVKLWATFWLKFWGKIEFCNGNVHADQHDAILAPYDADIASYGLVMWCNLPHQKRRFPTSDLFLSPSSCLISEISTSTAFTYSPSLFSFKNMLRLLLKFHSYVLWHGGVSKCFLSPILASKIKILSSSVNMSGGRSCTSTGNELNSKVHK